jgi:hypothetical protein
MFKYFDFIVVLAFLNASVVLLAYSVFFTILSMLGHSLFILATLMFVYVAISDIYMNYKIDNNIEL